MPAQINLDKLSDRLRTKRIGKSIFHCQAVDSTNNWAREIVEMGAAEGTVTIAEVQTSGRGRLDREWFSPKGGLYFSVVLRPEVSASEAVRLVFVAGLAVAEVLHELYGLKAETKWPNDVLVNGRKVCGVLSEMSMAGEKVGFVVVGVGVNANVDVEKEFPEGLRAVATSLENELGRKVRLEELFRALLERFECLYMQFLGGEFTLVLEKWKGYAGFIGRGIEVTGEHEKLCGLALDVDDEGALILRLEDRKTKRIFVGDVSLKMKSEPLRFVIGCEFEEFKRYLERAGRYKRKEELDRLEALLRKGLLNLIVWRLDDEVVGNAIWHESNTEEHRKGDPRDEEDKEALHRLLGGKKDFVELHEVWVLEEHRGKGYGERFFEFFEEYMRDKGYERIVFYANHPAALAICRKHGYKEGGAVNIEGEAEYVFYLQLKK